MILCRYSTIKFMPDAETREFVTVGVVIHCPQTGEVLFELAGKGFDRVSRFWRSAHDELYANAHDLMLSTLESIKLKTREWRESRSMKGNALIQFMNSQTAPVEGFIVFSETQAIMAYDHHMQTMLDELFAKLVIKHA
ncbi:MAG: DUF3037 domain-containing protein [Enterovibrio sp.]